MNVNKFVHGVPLEVLKESIEWRDKNVIADPLIYQQPIYMLDNQQQFYYFPVIPPHTVQQQKNVEHNKKKAKGKEHKQKPPIDNKNNKQKEDNKRKDEIDYDEIVRNIQKKAQQKLQQFQQQPKQKTSGHMRKEFTLGDIIGFSIQVINRICCD